MSAEQHKIMVVEDSLSLQMMLQRALQQSPYELLFASNLTQARTHLQQPRLPDLFLINLQLQDYEHGTELIAELKSSEKFKMIPIVVMTGDTSVEMQERCKMLGVQEYIIKPFLPNQLTNTMAALLRKDHE